MRKNEVLLKVTHTGKNCFRGKKKVSEVPKNGVIREYDKF